MTILKLLPKELFTIYTDVEYPDYDIEAFIETIDIKNAFISLGFGDEACTLCYWNLKDGRKLVALNRSLGIDSELTVYYYDKGKLSEDPNYILGNNRKWELYDFIDSSKYSDAELSKLNNEFNSGTLKILYALPQKGKDLDVILYRFKDKANNITDEKLIGGVKSKWVKEKWQVERYK